MSTPALKNGLMPSGLVSNLEQVLFRRKVGAATGEGMEDNQHTSDKGDSQELSSSSSNSSGAAVDPDSSKPILLVTNADGIESHGLTSLVDALVQLGLYNVHVLAPQLDKSVAGHSITLRDTVAVTKVDIQGATAYEVSGTPVDCVSLALSGALFSWSKPLLVISGINRGSSCGNHMFYSGVVAGAREALLDGVPSISISLNWKKNESQESDFRGAASVCLPLITSAIRDIEKGVFPKGCLLNLEVPTAPLTNKGFKLTKPSQWRSTLSWNAIPANRNVAASRFLSNQQSLGFQLAQLSRDASAAGAARRFTTQKKNIEVVESVGVAGKSDSNQTVKYFRLELLEKKHEEEDEDLDFQALNNGFVAVTPICLPMHEHEDIRSAASQWISTAL